MSQYIATMGLTNTGGLGIISIDHTADTAEVEMVGGSKPIHQTVKLESVPVEDSEETTIGFYFFGVFYDLSDFVRTNL